MTRKQALHIALRNISDEEAIKKINEILDDMPFTRWSEGTIFDTIDQFIIDHGRYPNVTDFKKKGLPPHPVIKLRFGISLKEFLNKFYPAKCSSRIYFHKSREEWMINFQKQHQNIKPTSAKEYNMKRDPLTPTWGVASNLFGINRWLEWLEYCNATPYVKNRGLAKENDSTLYLTGSYKNIIKNHKKSV